MNISESLVLPIQEPSVIQGIEGEDSFLRLARKFGEPVKLDDGAYIKTLQVKDQSSSRVNTLSAKYGNGSFPFHSDGAFMFPPPRWILLRAASVEICRATHLKSFSELFRGIEMRALRSSIWVCNTGRRKYFTTLHFSHGGMEGYRYDENCISAANSIARNLEPILKERTNFSPAYAIEWKQNQVVAIPNWIYLHARGARPSVADDGRILQRIYIK